MSDIGEHKTNGQDVIVLRGDDWRKRAVLAEAEVRSLQTALAALKARDIRICLHCGREQEGVK